MAEQIAAHLNETTPYKITPEEVNQVLKYFTLVQAISKYAATNMNFYKHHF